MKKQTHTFEMPTPLESAIYELDLVTGFRFRFIKDPREHELRAMRTIALAFGKPLLADKLR